jgi:hypothetical protein
VLSCGLLFQPHDAFRPMWLVSSIGVETVCRSRSILNPDYGLMPHSLAMMSLWRMTLHR